MSDVRAYGRDRAAIREAVLARVGGNRAGDRAAIAAIVDDIAGDYWPRLHGATIAFLERSLGPAFGGSLANGFAERVEVEGDVAALRALAQRSTVVLAPTHSSNLDSLVLGAVITRYGLPPFAYASGKHIHRHRVFAQLMRRLGVYKLDPDRRDRLYLRVVNVYVHELLARGYHSVIFPSGTRCRSGEVESRLKLGLLGAAMHVDGPLAIVPVTINYQIVLEAEHLIAYHLAGRSRERIVGDEMFVWGRLRETVRRLRHLDQRVVLRFGAPIDPRALGAMWRSRLVDEVTTAYRRATVFFATHVVARAVFDGADLAATRDQLRPWIWPGLAHLGDDDFVEVAIAAWKSWHRTPPVTRRGDTLEITNPDLLLFYRNRTSHLTLS